MAKSYQPNPNPALLSAPGFIEPFCFPISDFPPYYFTAVPLDVPLLFHMRYLISVVLSQSHSGWLDGFAVDCVLPWT